MIPVLSRAEMRAFDAHAITSCHVPSLVLMENAGRGAADVIERELLSAAAKDRRVVVFAGTGNNGGDGFVVARHLLGRGARVEVWLAGDVSKTTPDCKINHDAFLGIGGKVEQVPLGQSLHELASALAGADVAVDAIFGTGLDRPIVEPIAGLVRVLLEARARGRTRVAALDVPSGLDADTGASMGEAVVADLTITFAHLKLGHTTPHGALVSGPVHVVDIGVPPSIRADHTLSLVESSDVRALVAKRPVDAHKYSAGHVALLASSAGKIGAGLLAARGALRGGAGAATIVTWDDVASALEARIVEVMIARLPPVQATSVDVEALEGAIDTALHNKRAVVMGPGFGTGDASRAATSYVLASFRGGIVADADVFTLHAGSPEHFAVAEGRVVLTPHSGELGRLLGRPSSEIEADRFAAVREAAARTKAVVLLKGAYTVVASPDGRVVVSGAGGPSLATAGAGDVLSGLIGALMCSLPPFEAAWCGAFIHGMSGSVWSKRHGDRGLLAGEIADGLPDVIATLLSGRA